MGFTFVTEQRAAHLRVEARGAPESEADLAELADRVASLGSARGCDRILLDQRRLDCTLSVASRMRAIDQMAKTMRAAGIPRIACVERTHLRGGRQIEARARMKGLEYAFFLDPEEAEAWLLRSPEEAQGDDAPPDDLDPDEN